MTIPVWLFCLWAIDCMVVCWALYHIGYNVGMRAGIMLVVNSRVTVAVSAAQRRTTPSNPPTGGPNES